MKKFSDVSDALSDVSIVLDLFRHNQKESPEMMAYLLVWLKLYCEVIEEDLSKEIEPSSLENIKKKLTNTYCQGKDLEDCIPCQKNFDWLCDEKNFILTHCLGKDLEDCIPCKNQLGWLCDK